MGAADQPASGSQHVRTAVHIRRVRLSVFSRVHPALEAARPPTCPSFPECCHKGAVASGRLPPWIARGRKIEASFSGQERER